MDLPVIVARGRRAARSIARSARGSQVAEAQSNPQPGDGSADVRSVDAPDAFDADLAANAAADHHNDAPIDDRDWTSWSSLWQVPAIVLSIALIGIGVWSAMQREEPPALSLLLDHAEELIADSQLETTAAYLESDVKTRLHEAGPMDEARFHAIVADWIAMTQQEQGVSLEKNNILIDEEYQKATSTGMMLSDNRLERWAIALVELGRLDDAYARLHDLEALLASQSSGPDAQARRNRVFRRIVKFALNEPDQDFAKLSSILENYRRDSLLDIDNEIWAVARQAELRIDAAEPQKAIDHLLIEMRRLESRITAADRAAFGELYMILGRAYQRSGNDAHAQFNLQKSLEYFQGSEVPSGWAHVVLGQIDSDHGRYETALEHFDFVVRNFEASPCRQPALLGRAAVFSIIGEHEQAIADYIALRDVLLRFSRQVQVTIDRLVESLVNRHDAALAMGRLHIALKYLDVTKPISEQFDPKPDVLLRHASTSRQIADNVLSSAQHNDETGASIPLDRVDPEIRYEASQMYEQAAEWSVQHARATRTDVNEQDAWAHSLWLAGDSYDKAGLHDQAVLMFREYLGTRSEIDPRRPEAMFRLAQTHEALMDFENAAKRYQQVLDEHPRSTFATSSFVPLARVLQHLDRRPEAEQLLVQVVQGDHVIQPDATDYRDALMHLGGLQYESGQYARAIEHLDAAVKRYPDDPRINEVRFRLADSHRRYGLELEDRAETDATLTPAGRQAFLEQRVAELEKAQTLFDAVVRAYGDRPTTQLDALQQDFNRRAHLYRADCAFLLKDFEQAIALYDETARQYSDQHSSLIALIQIVNCYYGLSDPQRAHTAEQRARVRLKQLPASAFEADDALMDRAAWERWLANNPPGQSLAAVDS